jgi:hypothetical protein
MRVDVIYNDVNLEVVGTYIKGEQRTYDYPGSNSDFEIDLILVGGFDIQNILNFEQIEKITDLVIEEIEL